MSVASFARRMEETPEQARQTLLDDGLALMKASGLRASGNNILVAVYERAGKKTAGGIIIPGTDREDEFQGKVGVVLDIGPMCRNAPDATNYDDWFGGSHATPKVGDWVGINIRNGLTLKLGPNGLTCRLFVWDKIEFTVTSPDEIE